MSKFDLAIFHPSHHLNQTAPLGLRFGHFFNEDQYRYHHKVVLHKDNFFSRYYGPTE
jgi:hypothetical protein